LHTGLAAFVKSYAVKSYAAESKADKSKADKCYASESSASENFLRVQVLGACLILATLYSMVPAA